MSVPAAADPSADPDADPAVNSADPVAGQAADAEAESGDPAAQPVARPAAGKGAAELTSFVESPELLYAKRRLVEPATVADKFLYRVRRREDLFSALLCVAGLAIVLLLSVYAASTTLGMVEDARAVFGSLVRQLLFLPVSVLEGLFVIAAPVWLIGALVAEGRYRTVAQAVVTLLVASLLGWGLTLVLPYLPAILFSSLFVVTDSGMLNSVNVVQMALATFATVVGSSQSMRSVTFTWGGIWVLLILGVLQGTATLPGILVTVLLGRALGMLGRWIWGFSDRRAKPVDLVRAVLDAGYLPKRIVRADLPDSRQPLDLWQVFEMPGQLDYTTGQVNAKLTEAPLTAEPSSFEVTVQPSKLANRRYRLWDGRGETMDLHVIDPQNVWMSTLGDLWDNLRLRGISRAVSSSNKMPAERALLLSQMVLDAGVLTAKPLGIAEAGDSVVVLWEALPPMAPLLQAENSESIPDALLDQAWEQLEAAYRRGITHRNLDVDNLAVDEKGEVWLLDWSQGEAGGGETAHRIDHAQMLAHLALAAGAERAVASALRVIGRENLLATGPFVQTAVLPPGLRHRLQRTGLVDELKSRIQACAPAQTANMALPAAKLQRFSARTVVMILIGVVALVTVFGSLNFEDIANAVAEANCWWILGAFGIGLLTWIGGAFPLIAFSPRRLSWRDSIMAQVAASIVNLVVPAGIGAAALNLRFLNRNQLSTPVAVATVTLVQISQFLTSVVLLVVIVASTGSALTLEIPTLAIMWVIIGLVAVLGGLLSVSKLRRWAIAQVRNYWQQVYPQLMWLVGHPKQLLLAFTGNLLMNIGYIGAFGMAVGAFGYALNPMTMAITYLVSSTVGSVIPSPGGIGPVEAALMGGLTVVGIPSAVALSAAIVFRLVTFYGRVPFGWLALRYLEKKGML